MVITTQFTKDYKAKADLLAASVAKHWDGRFIPIEFEPEEVESYRPGWPSNRSQYVSMQAGEFLSRPEFADVPDDEVIICLDADTVMNRAFTKEELATINRNLQQCHFLSVRGAYPGTILQLSSANIELRLEKLDEAFYSDCFKEEEFTASILIARKKHFAILKRGFIADIQEFQNCCKHHAVGQFLINLICYKYFIVGRMQKDLQCGSWYDGCTEDDAANAIFNHTK